LLAGSGALATAALPAASAEPIVPIRRPLKVLVCGGHPDDPESSSGGTIAKYSSQGHAVSVLYLTRGERGIIGKTRAEAGAIRTAEAENACKIMGARAIFAGQINGAVEVTAARYAEYLKFVEAENPDVIFTHWPLDSHPDHAACSVLTYNAWLKMGRKAALYYFEVNLGGQTSCFHPTDYVDVSAQETTKRDACFAHVSQNAPHDFWPKYHEPMLRFRGMESRYKAAEAFVRHSLGPEGRLPE
jgi:LmbE family N-acetylglucosaminyl deacetylase